MQSYINIKSIHLTLSQLISQQNVTMVLDDTNRLTPYHVIHGWFPVMPFHYIACCSLRYIPKTTNVTFDGMCREGRYG